MKNRIAILLGLTVFAVAAASYAFLFGAAPARQATGDGYALTAVGDSLKYLGDSQAIFYSYNSKDFFYCTKDGMKYYAEGSLVSSKWTQVFSMSAPKLVSDCGVVAVAEERGKDVYVFNAGGLMYSKRFESPVLSFSVNKLGFLSVVLQNGDDYEIQVFTDTGAAPSTEKWVYNDYNRFPVASSVSGDGRALAVSFIDINGVQVSSNIVFMYLNMAEARSWPDGIFGDRTLPGEYVANIRFMENNSLLAFSDAGIHCYGLSENKSAADRQAVEDRWDILLDNKVDMLSFYGDAGFAVAYGDALLNRAGEAPGTVRLYGADGQADGEYRLDGRVTYLSAGASGVIAGSNRNYYVLSAKGQLLWNYSSIQDLRQLIFLENNNSVLLAGSQAAQLMRRAKAKAEPTASAVPSEVSE